MLASGETISSGSFDLAVLVTDLNVQRSIRVKGDMHVGGVMFKLVESFNGQMEIGKDWSDHGLWWPERGKWLHNTRLSLDQCRISANHILHFTPMHKVARVQLPDLQFMDVKLNFSVPVFSAVVQFCRELGIRHPEELSFKYDVDPHILKRLDPLQRPTDLHFSRRGSLHNISAQQCGRMNGSTTLPSLHSQSAFNVSSPDSTYNPLNGSHVSPSTPTGGGYLTLNGKPLSPVSPSISFDGSLPEELDLSLAQTPGGSVLSTRAALARMFRPKNLSQKAVLNRGWLDSSVSLLEQGVREFDTILLRFRYLQFFDLNPKLDPKRLNQLYAQAKWSVLAEEVDCTEEELIMFAALQLQIQMQGESLQIGSALNNNGPQANTDDVETALDDLQIALEGSHVSSARSGSDITSIPELSDCLKYFKPRKLTLKAWKRGYFVFKDLTISYYTSQDDAGRGNPVGRILVKGCEVIPDVTLHQEKFCIKLLVPTAEGMNEFWIRCFSKEQYAKWMAACKLAAKGKSMADSCYTAEVESLRRLLAMQIPSIVPPSTNNQSNGNDVPDSANGNLTLPTAKDVDPEDLVPPRALRRMRGGRNLTVQRILDAHRNVADLSLSDAKLQLVSAWQSLPEFGIHYFIVRFRRSRKPDLLGITYNRMMRMNMENGEVLQTWRFSTMTRWHVNWEIRSLMIQCDDEEFIFEPLSCTCKTVHEFIGGYIFLAMRSKEQGDALDEKQFFELTGGRPV